MAFKIASNSWKLLTNFVNNSRLVPERGIKNYVSKLKIELKKRQVKYLESLTEEERIELNRRSSFVEWNYSSEIFAFGKRLHEDFRPELLVQAFTHRSYIVKKELENKKLQLDDPSVQDLKDNDTLASDGENIITHYCGRYVSHFFPKFPLEGIESVVHHLSSDELLAHVSKNLGTTHLILSSDFPVEIPTYAKTLKAIVGALKESTGLQRSQLFVRDFIVTQLSGKDINDFLEISDCLQVLREILSKEGREPPEPRLICQSAMNTIMANYHVGIYSNKQLIGHCSGESIDTAVEMAAFDALKRLFNTTDSCSPMSYNLKTIPERITNVKLGDWQAAAFEKSKRIAQ